jgi:hypothetical protein
MVSTVQINADLSILANTDPEDVEGGQGISGVSIP